MRTILVMLGCVAILSGCSPDLPDDVAAAYDTLPRQLDFNLHVKPILSDKCYACHGPDQGKIEAGLQLHASDAAYAELPENPGKFAIVPGNLRKSEAFHRIMSADPAYIMPTPESHLNLTAEEKATLIKWIEDGAEYEPHWAFIPVEAPEVPEVEQEDWAQNPIDQFILAKLEEQSLQPNEEAPREMLLRRLSLDLTGLPPTPAEVRAFVEDQTPGAYERQVDRLLASKRYGERMATDWMDVARFTDTHGYQVDRYRDMSPWRDWVIEAFNENMPYDQFVTWQLAGDLLPDATEEQRLATGFNRLHPQNMEGGIVDEEFRVEYVADRVALTGQAFMGLTIACARCHDHKYDPISQKNFYELFSFFNNVNETGQISWDPGDMPVPNMLIPDEDQRAILSFLERQSDSLERAMAQTSGQAQHEADTWIASEAYQKVRVNYESQQVGHFPLDGHLRNRAGRGQGKMAQRTSKNEKPVFEAGKFGKGLLMDGDVWLDLDPMGIFGRNEAFSIGIWVNIPEELEEGVIFHKNQAVMLHSMKGYSLYLKDNKLELVMAHTYPDNAIIEISEQEIPKDQWVQLTMTYDGSSTAEGLRLYLDGEEMAMNVEIDNLYKDIIFHQYGDVIYEKPIEPPLKVGARWRGIGLKQGRVDDVRVFEGELTPLEVRKLGDPAGYTSWISQAADQLSGADKEILSRHYLMRKVKPYRQTREVWAEVQSKLVTEMDDVQEVMVMKEMPEARQAYILERGQYNVYGDSVFPNTPESILAFDPELPKNRLGLAQWLLDPKNPLTARVTVNRYWQQYFGTGIVRTAEDFGNQGELPTHRQLIDWLAAEFIENGWDIKALQKQIVMSATYRQSSMCSEELRELDPENRLLARGPVVRLTSEMIRDNALLASNLMNHQIGGPSVKPYQPPGLWKMNSDTYVPDTGEDLYRRSLYTYWKRTVPYPTQATFDQPERNECTVRRQKTNTPLQALVLLNDPTFIEASRKLGETMARAESPESGIESAYQSLTGREITAPEMDIMLELLAHEQSAFEADPKRAQGWLETGEYRIDPTLNPNLVAAHAVVANAILNSDATLMKR
ncbi:DUF1553 domain-containing protein [Pontibacter sp. G13]|uniref:DUF1553 domain-containing protein n=1 Tax=Pontibacter sp. G13 TaxID=3074898 RepID=UPI00288A17E6|nr:DUF1553 domain-containing protein [Pontibacter sp. G13]WNJ17908.1 DUF1553 domain-containing protein [Pontibacter sp. G13]